MSLRARLTLLYATLLGGTLLIFGVLIYLTINAALLGQIDSTLTSTVRSVVQNARVSDVGDVSVITLPTLELTTGVYLQFWDRDGKLTQASPGIRNLIQPLDPPRLESSTPVIATVYVQNSHLRVLTVPIRVGDRPVGTVQAAINLLLADVIRNELFKIVLIITIASMVLAASASWISIGQSLAPLETVTETALQITRADDLSRRIQYHGPQGDEIGTLIRAFNRTLERLETLFTSQQRFLADVSHELRTPLTVIKGNADLIRKFGPDDESIDSIKDEADRLTRMVGDLLLLAQAESGKLPLNLKAVELDALLTDVFQDMRVLAGDKVRLKLTEIDQVQVSGDKDRLRQVLINLISNAIHYTPQGGEVTIGLSKAGEMARFQVQDTGPGIPAKDLPHIFDRFYRTEKARTRSKTSGFGLGLSIVSAIVDHHGGHINVESKEGQGTTFTVFLPLFEENE
jgi:heavy metal sensor kinase